MSELPKSAVFIKAVAKYFMDFLETDFHKRRNPRRAIKLRNADNILIGIQLNKYPAFFSIVWKEISKNITQEPIRIQKGAYRADPPKNLIELVSIQIEKIPEVDVERVRKEIANAIENYGIAHKDEYTLAYEKTVESARTAVKEVLSDPFIASIEKSLQSIDVADDNSVFMMGEELTDVLLRLIEGRIGSLLTHLIAEENPNIEAELSEDFGLSVIKEEVTDFFDQLKTNDLFQELFEIDRNKNILDKQELYLYFGDITYANVKYPIFYIPLTLSFEGGSLNIQPDSQVYINKKSLEYIAQEYNSLTGKKGALQGIGDRIIYLSQHTEDFCQFAQWIMDEISNFFELEGRIDLLETEAQTAKSSRVRLANGLNIVLFDKSDEALINDYEELLNLEDDSELALELSELIEGFIEKNPDTVVLDVDREWSDLEVSDRLVSANPIPLNSEQRKILMALKREGCKYITVEGPPGTGKSHTITAIVFDAILENKSVLILSDKKEALDVVEDKISETMNKVRFDSDFQNPILRLGNTGNTYRQILQPASIGRIKTSYLVMRKEFTELETNIASSISSLKEDIDADKLSAKNINVEEILELGVLEHELQSHDTRLDLEELSKDDNSFIDLEELREVLLVGKELAQGRFEGSQCLNDAGLALPSDSRFSNLNTYLLKLAGIAQSISKAYGVIDSNQVAACFASFPYFGKDNLPILEGFIARYKRLKKPLVGFQLSKARVQELDFEFQGSFPVFQGVPHESLDSLALASGIFHRAFQLGEQDQFLKENNLDILKLLSVYSDLSKLATLQQIALLRERVEYVTQIISKYPKTSELAGLSGGEFGLAENYITSISQLEFDKVLRFLNVKQRVEASFAAIPIYNYLQQKKDIEKMVTSKMTYLMDERLVNFALNSSADAQVLKNIIKSKEKFPREQFGKLKSAFPCILAGVRDYAEFIPLDAGIFDLVIIDEASQVSIAQAFPALLRAKKVLILGDKLQFGNVKALQAKSDINTEYVNGLRGTFRENVSSEAGALKKLEYFNVKKSILDFFGFISNYQTMLVKHFRGYRENISFSNKYFYQNNLQVMKIRGKKIDDIISFHVIEHDGKVELKANKLESDYILGQLSDMRNNGGRQSVGIITPHTNQQKVINDAISKDPNRDYYLNDLRLKVMTFDTCQGEERDIIFYSMVATKEDDRLQYVFSKDLEQRSDEDEEDSLRKQRLNVGFSRSKESMRFVLSKPVEDFRGAIGGALLHYQQVLEDAKRERDVSEVDDRSAMEPKILNWFYQTSFWNLNKERIDFNPQFEIGKYLKQLDPTYNHPAYKVDFLICYADEAGKDSQIIIEYDGFQEHGMARPDGSAEDYEDYYSGEDIYRQKVLESYGYKFLRINKFNLGDNPIEQMDHRIAALLSGRKSNSYLSQIVEKAKSFHDGEMKECPSCGEILPLGEFKDASLTSGMGRICMKCKLSSHKDTITAEINRLKPCPLCGGKMKLRDSYRGKFYGCINFPRCRGTRTRSEM